MNFYLHATVAPSLCHSVDILFQSVNIWVLGNIGSGFLHCWADMFNILHQLINKSLNKIILSVK